MTDPAPNSKCDFGCPCRRVFLDFLERRWTLAVTLLMLVALAARVVGLNRGMWVDELKTWLIVHWSMADMLANRFAEGHLPAYFVLIRGWIELVGPRPWAMRLPSVVASLAGVFLVLRLGREGYSRPVAFVGAALFAIHGVEVWSAQIVRMYAMLSLEAVAASWLLLRLERTRRWPYFVAYALVSALGLVTQALFAFFMVCQLAYLVWNNVRRPARQWKTLLAWALAWGAAAPVWAILKARQHQIDADAKKWQVNIERMLRYSSRVVFGDYSELSIERLIVWPAIAVLLVAGGLVLWAAFRPVATRRLADDGADEAVERARSLTRYIVCWVGGFLLIMFVFANFVDNKAGNCRYYSPIVGGVCLGLSAAIFALPRLRLQQALGAAIVFFILLTSVAWWRFPGDGLKRAIDRVESRRGLNEGVVGCNDVSVGTAYHFYCPKAAKDALTVVSRWKATVPSRIAKCDKDLERVEEKYGATDDAALEKAYGDKPDKLERLRLLREWRDLRAPADEGFWRRLYGGDKASLEALADLRATLIEAAKPTGSLWVVVYHEDNSPIVKVAHTLAGHEVVSHERIADAQVLRLKRVDPSGR